MATNGVGSSISRRNSGDVNGVVCLLKETSKTANGWMNAVVVRLNDDLTDVGDVLVSVSYNQQRPQLERYRRRVI